MIKIENLPEEIWIKTENAVKLSTSLEYKYIKCLHDYNAFDMAKEYDGKGSPIGGESDEIAIQHFAYRFVNSGTRITHIILDPDKKFSKIQEDIFATFSQGRISILDLASGTGGHILSLLTTIVELRKNRLIPTLPIHIYILAADISPKALEIYEKILDDIKPYLIEFGLIIYFDKMIWDACSPSNTNTLMNKFFSNTEPIDINEYYVITSAFSGFAGREENFLTIKRSLEHIAERLSSEYSTFLWIEPNTKKSDKFHKYIALLFNNLLDTFIIWIGLKTETKNQYSWWEPLKNIVIPTGQANVKIYKRDNEEF